jgi:hypothetical protein
LPLDEPPSSAAERRERLREFEAAGRSVVEVLEVIRKELRAMGRTHLRPEPG